jgi:hypothetical protein
MRHMKFNSDGVLIEHTLNGVQQPIVKPGLGDKIARIATPIARMLGFPCVDPKTGQLKNDSGCAKRRDVLNKL